MSAESKSTDKKENVSSPVAEANNAAEVNNASKHLNLTLCSEDFDLLNSCANSYYKRESIINTAWLGFGFFLGMTGSIRNFMAIHPLVYFGMFTLSSASQSWIFDDYNKTCEDTFVNSELKTPFAQFVRERGWPNILGQNSVTLLLKEAEKEKDTKNQTRFGSLFSWKAKEQKNVDETKS